MAEPFENRQQDHRASIKRERNEEVRRHDFAVGNENPNLDIDHLQGDLYEINHTSLVQEHIDSKMNS